MQVGLALVQHRLNGLLPPLGKRGQVARLPGQGVCVLLFQCGQLVEDLLPRELQRILRRLIRIRRGVTLGKALDQLGQHLARFGIETLDLFDRLCAIQLQPPALVGAQERRRILLRILLSVDKFVVKAIRRLGGVGLDLLELAVDVLAAQIGLADVRHVGELLRRIQRGVGLGQKPVDRLFILGIVEIAVHEGVHLLAQRGLGGRQLRGNLGEGLFRFFQRGVDLLGGGAQLDLADALHDGVIVELGLRSVDLVVFVAVADADQFAQKGTRCGELLPHTALDIDRRGDLAHAHGVGAVRTGRRGIAPEGVVHTAALGVPHVARAPVADKRTGHRRSRGILIGGVILVAVGLAVDRARVVGVLQAERGLLVGVADDAAGAVGIGIRRRRAIHIAVVGHIVKLRIAVLNDIAENTADPELATHLRVVGAFAHLGDAGDQADDAAHTAAFAAKITQLVAAQPHMVLAVADQAAIAGLTGPGCAGDAADGIDHIAAVFAVIRRQEKAVGAAVFDGAAGHAARNAADGGNALPAAEESRNLAVVDLARVGTRDEAGAGRLHGADASGSLHVFHRAIVAAVGIVPADIAEQTLNGVAFVGAPDAVDDMVLAVEGAHVGLILRADGGPLLTVQVDVRRQHGAGRSAAAVDLFGKPCQLRARADPVGVGLRAAARGLGLRRAVPLVRHAGVDLRHGVLLAHGKELGIPLRLGRVQRCLRASGFQRGKAVCQRLLQCLCHRFQLLRGFPRPRQLMPDGREHPTVGVERVELLCVGRVDILLRRKLFARKFLLGSDGKYPSHVL